MSPFPPPIDSGRTMVADASLDYKVHEEGAEEEEELNAEEDPIKQLDIQLREHFTLLYMLEPGNHLNSKLGVRELYRKDLLTSFFYKEPLTALYAHKFFQALSFIYGGYLVTMAYMSTLKYHDYEHRLVKIDTVLVETDYQRNPTRIDFSLASCSWNENLSFVLAAAQGLSYMLSSVFAFFECMKAPRRIIVLGGWIVGIGNLVLAVGARDEISELDNSQTLTLFFVTIFVFPCPILFLETFALELLVVSLVIRIIGYATVRSYRIELLVAFVLFFAALLHKISRRIAASKELRVDAAMFDSAWKSITSMGQAQSALQETDRLINEFFVSFPGKSTPTSRHTFIMPSSSMEAPTVDGSNRRLSRMSSRSRVMPIDSMISISVSSLTDSIPSYPVHNLDQLYARSVVVLPMLLRKVMTVGIDWSGYCCIVNADGQEKQYLLYKDLEKSPAAMRNVYFSSIKNINRSVEKILAFLYGDVSQLTDVVRQSIFFNSLEDLNGALKQLMEDTEIEIAYIRNRLSRPCSGYRDITLNICFTNDQAIQNNLLGHICEVRLALIELHSLVSPASHEACIMRKLILQTRKMDKGNASNVLFLIKQRRKFLQTFTFVMQSGMMVSEGAAEGDTSSVSSLLMAAKGMVPGGLLDHLVHSVEAGVHDAKTGSVIFSSRPLSNVIHKRMFQMGLVVAGVVMIVTYVLDDYLPIMELVSRSHFAVSHARIKVLRTRSPVAPNASLERFSFLRDCVKLTPELKARNESHFYFSFPSPISANGWEFYTGSQDSSYQHDPTALELHVTQDSAQLDPTSLSEASWALKSKFDCGLSPRTELCEPKEENVTRTRNQRYHFDLRISWQCVAELVNISFRMIATFGTPILAQAGFTLLGKIAVACAFHATGVVDLIVATFTPLPLLGFLQSFLWGLFELAYGSVMQFKEQYTLTLLPVYCLAGSFMNTLLINLRDGEFSVTISTLRPNHIFLFFAWVSFFVWRRYLLYKSFKRIERDIFEYDELWRQVAQDERNLAELNDTMNRLQVHCSAIQHLSLPSDGMRIPRTPIGLESTFRPQLALQIQEKLARKSSRLVTMMALTKELTMTTSQLRVNSLEQLYAQALVVQPVFFEKVKELGSRCNCFFLLDDFLRENERYIAWKEITDVPDRITMIKRPALKNVSRAIQKVVRSYNGDVSRLTDIVRYALVFDDIVELRRAVELIMEDSDIRVVRVKNRLDPNYKSIKSGGYRDICMNISISNHYTQRLFIDHHLCELQLVLRSFMDLRNEKGHKNYRVFRDQRCE